jgi:hypothetical protein
MKNRANSTLMPLCNAMLHFLSNCLILVAIGVVRDESKEQLLGRCGAWIDVACKPARPSEGTPKLGFHVIHHAPTPA